MQKKINIKNKKASFQFLFTEEFVAGIVLVGSEVKSIKNGMVSFTDCYCFFRNDEIFVKNLHISEYKQASYNQHDPKRDKKLLLTKREIKKIKEKVKEKGFTVVPTKLFVNDKGMIKISIALAKGKKLYDKRETIKKRDDERKIELHKKNYF